MASQASENRISAGDRTLSKEKLLALSLLRHTVLEEIRTTLRERLEYLEATPSTLVNIAGSCENPRASFKVDYYGRPAYLSQSAQLQLEALVLRLQRGFFTVNNSFREEHFEDPETPGRRLSEFTLIEAEKPRRGEYQGEVRPQNALQALMHEQQILIARVLGKALKDDREKIDRLCRESHRGGESQTEYLGKVYLLALGNIAQWTYDQALQRLNESEFSQQQGKQYRFGDDLGTLEERELIRQNEGMPLFITHHPASLKFFNMKRTPDGRSVYSVDLLMPKLGETIGGAVREADGNVIREQLEASKVGAFMREQGISFPGPFAEYFRTLAEEPLTPRAGYGIGFERLMGFLIGSTDILDTVAYRTLQP